MLCFRRPVEPEDFDERTREARARVERAVEAGQRPDFEPPIWRDYKRHFVEAQHEKCAYCETKVLVSHFGHVDHFRPKSAISELDDDPATWGREKPGLSNVEGRRSRPISDQGYWWLAYEWSNLLFACERCNSPWKGTLFPVTARSLPPRPDSTETPLLLDPYGEENPNRHLRFGEMGSVEPKDESAMGFETIRTLGLDRESLRNAREEKAHTAFRLARDVKDMLDLRERTLDEILNEILDSLDIGREEYAYAGMARVILEQELGVDWTELESIKEVTANPR